MTHPVGWRHGVTALLLALAPLFSGCRCRPEPPDFEAGVRLFLQGQYSSAEIQLRKFLAETPTGPQAAQAHALLGSIALRRRDTPRAQQHFASCLRLSPAQEVAETAHIGLARCRFLRSEYRQCKAACLDFLGDHPDTSRADEVLFLLAEATAHDGQTAEAQRLYRDVASQFPSSPYAAKARARLSGGASPDTSGTGSHMVQIAALASVAKAETHARLLRARGYPAVVVAVRSGGKTLHTVRAGPYANRADAVRAAQRLKAEGFDAIVKP